MRWFALLMMAIVCLLLVSPAQAAEPEDPGDNFSHSVVLELFVTTWCQYCPDGEVEAARLNLIYKQNYHFMSMVTDVNDEAEARGDDYAVNSYPSAIFDGDYREDRTGNPDSYEGHIEACGERNVAPITLTVSLEDEGDGNVRVGYSATYTGTTWPWQDVNLKVAMVEPISRYKNLHNESIPYGFVDYAFDKDITLYSQTEQSESTTWDASDCDLSNLIVIGAVYDSLTGYGLQTASTETYADLLMGNVSWEPVHPGAGERITVSVPVEGDVANVTVEVAACSGDTCLREEVIQMTNDGGTYSADIGKFKEGYSIHMWVVAEDSEGAETKTIEYVIHIGKGGGDDGSESLPGFEALTMTLALFGAILITRRLH